MYLLLLSAGVCSLIVSSLTENSFIVPPPDPDLSPEDRDHHDLLSIYQLLNERVLPSYYDRPDEWSRVVFNSMNDVVPFFDASRLVNKLVLDATDPLSKETDFKKVAVKVMPA